MPQGTPPGEIARRGQALTEKAAIDLARIASIRLIEILKTSLSTPGTGRIYRRKSVTHRASRPGMPPAPDTGTLRRGVRAGAGGGDPKVFRVLLGPRYGQYLEEGTATIAPRPWVRPGLQTLKAEFPNIVTVVRNRG
jgi:hypothetical protein